MKNRKLVAATVAAIATVTSLSSVADEGSRWTFSAGPAWRSRVRMETTGVLGAPAPEPRSTTKRDMQNPANWFDGDHKLVPDPYAGIGGIPEDGKVWAIDDYRTEIYGTAGRGYFNNSSEERSPLGLNLQAGYDFYQSGTLSVGLNLRFAGYWNMKSSTCGYYDAGTTLTEIYADRWIFPQESPADPFFPDPEYGTIEYLNSTLASSVLNKRGSRYVSTRLRSDLYQIGIGPKVTWTPFAGRCECMEWLDVYAGVEVLGNIAHTKLEADRFISSSTDFLIGFGGNVGIVGNITDWLGIYGQIGYEWVDKNDVSAGSFKSEVDYSSLVLAAGIQFRF